MSKTKLYLIFFFFILIGCSYNGGNIKTLIIKEGIPEYFLTDISEGDARDKIIKGLQTKSLKDNGYYQEHGFKSSDNPETTLSIHAEDKSNNLWGKDFFSQPQNQDKIFLHTMGASFVSECYIQNGDPIAYKANFSIEIEPYGSKLKISVSSFDSSISYGGKFNSHALGWVLKNEEVNPSSVENYKVLAIIANLLGEKLKKPEFYISKHVSEDKSC